jgi:hypothetical protein
MTGAYPADRTPGQALDDARSALGMLEVHVRDGFLTADTAVRLAARRLRGTPVLGSCAHDYLTGCPLCPLEAALTAARDPDRP